MAQPDLKDVSPEADTLLRRLARACDAEGYMAHRYGLGHSSWVRLTGPARLVTQPARWYAGTMAAILRVALEAGALDALNELLSAILDRPVRLLLASDGADTATDASASSVLREFGLVGGVFGRMMENVSAALDDGVVTEDEYLLIAETCDHLSDRLSSLRSEALGAVSPSNGD